MIDFGKLDFAVSFSPLTAFPLDARYYFESLASANLAAQSAVEVGSSDGRYFFGENIVVVENGEAKMYIIQPDKSLKEVGGNILINEKVFLKDANGKLDLVGFADAVAGAQLTKGEDGNLKWVKPDTTTIEGLSTAVESLKTTENGKKESLKLIYGDTWFDRYDCLKTYPFTKEDPNQIVEIGSFMCETRVNLNGRYDRNKGELSCLNMSPTNFNLLNNVYNQKDTFFNYRILDKDINKMNHFPYQYTWSLQKINGSDVDNWTNTTLANTADMDGAYGRITKLCTFNDVLLGFQEKALNAINFNNRVQIPVSDGVPIEISNGYKVDGSKVISSDVGC